MMTNPPVTPHWERYVFGPLAVNTFLVFDPEGGDGLIVDPGENSPQLRQRLQDLGPKRWTIFLTHGHADHILGVPSLRDELPAEVWISREDAPMLADPELNLSKLLGLEVSTRPAERLLAHGEKITVGRFTGELIAVPGHTAGGLALRFPGLILAGDTLFAGSIARSDFPGGDGYQLVRMIKDRLLVFPEDLVLPGHGANTAIAEEAAHNPFLNTFSTL